MSDIEQYDRDIEQLNARLAEFETEYERQLTGGREQRAAWRRAAVAYDIDGEGSKARVSKLQTAVAQTELATERTAAAVGELENRIEQAETAKERAILEQPARFEKRKPEAAPRRRSFVFGIRAGRAGPGDWQHVTRDRLLNELSRTNLANNKTLKALLSGEIVRGFSFEYRAILE